MDTILKKTKTEKGNRIVYLAAFALLLLSFLITLFTNKQLVEQSARLEQTNNVIYNLDKVLEKVKDGETGFRGYVMTKDIQFLFPYYGSQQKADSFYSMVLNLVHDNPIQQERLKILKTSMNRHFEQLRYGIRSFDDNNRAQTDSMKKMQQLSINVMNEIRSAISLMDREEKTLLIVREERMKRTFRIINIIMVISILLAFSLFLFGFITYLDLSKARKKGRDEIAAYQEQLKNQIGELNKVNAELIRMRSQEKFAATGRIARTIAHEVRNPLTNINLAIGQLKDDVFQENEEGDLLFEMINRNSNRINQLISDLLNSTKFSELNYKKISINSLLDEALEDAADRIALSKIRVVKKYSADICDVYIDKEKIKIALLNIIINALEAMENKEGPILTLETKGGDKCAVVIRDNGSGMDAESVNRVFEPYFTSKSQGNGLGLTNTQNIILNHNGEISVESTEGKGTVFTIHLDFAT